MTTIRQTNRQDKHLRGKSNETKHTASQEHRHYNQRNGHLDVLLRKERGRRGEVARGVSKCASRLREGGRREGADKADEEKTYYVRYAALCVGARSANAPHAFVFVGVLPGGMHCKAQQRKDFDDSARGSLALLHVLCSGHALLHTRSLPHPVAASLQDSLF